VVGTASGGIVVVVVGGVVVVVVVDVVGVDPARLVGGRAEPRAGTPPPHAAATRATTRSVARIADQATPTDHSVGHCSGHSRTG
jgi:predicted metalloprotease